MPRADIIIEIVYNLKEPDKTEIKTNAKKEALEEILGAWLTDQVGKGRDDRKPVKKEEYRVVIGLNLNDDSFLTNSDTGNKGLTCGIVMSVFNRLDGIKVSNLS